MVLLILSGWGLTLPAGARPWALLLGRADSAALAASANLHWLVQQRGLLGATHSRLLMFPSPIDRIAEQGFPLDALLSRPLLALLGWPAGYALPQIAALIACGLSAAWLAGRWWRSEAAALVAGVAYQSAPPVLELLGDGALGPLVGAALLPLAAGLLAGAATAERPGRDGLLAGALAGALGLLWWRWGALVALALAAAALLPPTPLSPPRRRRAALRGLACCLLGAAAVLAAPAGYSLYSLGLHAGAPSPTLDAIVTIGGERGTAAAIAAARSLGSAPWARYLLTALAVPALLAPARRWRGPAALLLLGLALAAGPALHPPGLPSPYAALAALDRGALELSPRRALLLAAPGAALLAGGGAAWLAERARGLRARWLGLRQLPVPLTGGALALGLLAEAALLDPHLPAAAAPWGPSERALQLAAGRGPALVLPPGGEEAAAILLDQLHHGRPLANGWLPPTDTLAPAPYRDAAGRSPLGSLLACGQLPYRPYSGDPAADRALLTGLGLRAIYLDREAASDGRYLACAGPLLGDALPEDGPYLHFPL